MTDRNSIGRSLAPGFNPAPSLSQGSTSTFIATQPPLPCKSKTRRKRHIPPGPAGVWYQAKQHIAAGNSRSKTTASTTNDEDNDDDDVLYNDTGKLPSRRRHYHGNHEPLPAPDVTIHPAWMLMQLQLPRLLTPYLPPYATTAQRYASLRQVLPNEYMLLPELLPDDTPLTALASTKTFDDEQDSPKLMVLVHAVHSHASCDWTAELQDETGTAIVAWIAPSLVMKERDTPDKVRAGVVWCLQGLSILPTMTKTSNRGNSSSNCTNLIESKCLLVKEASIIQYWVAPKEVSPQVYLDWMQKRNALPTSFLSSSVPSTGNDDDDERMEVEVDLPISTVPRAIGVSQQGQLRRDGEEHDDDVITADFGLQILPTLHAPLAQPRPPSLSDSRDSHGSTSVGTSQSIARKNPYGCHSRTSGSPRSSSPRMQTNPDSDARNSQRNDSHHSRSNIDSSPAASVPTSPPKRRERTNPYSSYASVETVPSPTTKGRSPLPLKQPYRVRALDQTSLQLPAGIDPSDANRPQQNQVNPLEPFAAPQGKKGGEVQKENQMPAKSNSKLRKTGSPKHNHPFSNFLEVAPPSMMAMFEDDGDDDDDNDVFPTRLELKKASDETELLPNGKIPDTFSLFQGSHCIDGLMKMFDEDDEDE